MEKADAAKTSLRTECSSKTMYPDWLSMRERLYILKCTRNTAESSVLWDAVHS